MNEYLGVHAVPSANSVLAARNEDSDTPLIELRKQVAQ